MRVHADNERSPAVPDQEEVELAVEVFRMLADATRLRILCVLLHGELAVQDLARTVGKAPSVVSQHLAKLRMARLVRSRRDGTQIFYRVEDDHLRDLVQDAIHHAEHAGPGVPPHHAATARLHHLPQTKGTELR
jgi:DNA-binding transcriptional ArsR family regulator